MSCFSCQTCRMIGIVKHTDHKLWCEDTIEARPSTLFETGEEIFEDLTSAMMTTTSSAVEETPAGEGNGEGDRTPPSFPSQPLNLLPTNYRPATVLIMGDSFVRRLRDYATRRFGPYNNLGLDYNVAMVNWYGIGGMTIHGFRLNHMESVYNIRPDVAMIHLGSNDLCCPRRSALDAGEEMEDLVHDLMDMGVHQVIISQVVFRKGRGIPNHTRDYNRKVTVFNFYNKLAYNPNQSSRARFWYHRGLWNQQFTTLLHDSVHLNARGSKHFLRSVRGGIIQGINRARPNLVIPPLQGTRPVVTSW